MPDETDAYNREHNTANHRNGKTPESTSLEPVAGDIAEPHSISDADDSSKGSTAIVR
jgi:hypothetical protein